MKFRATTLKRRPNTSDNGTVDIQIILNDDFYIQPTACLTEIIYEKYKDYILFNVIGKYLFIFILVL